MARVVPTAPAAQSMGDRSDLFLFDPLGYARVTVLEPDGCQFKAVKACICCRAIGVCLLDELVPQIPDPTIFQPMAESWSAAKEVDEILAVFCCDPIGNDPPLATIGNCIDSSFKFLFCIPCTGSNSVSLMYEGQVDHALKAADKMTGDEEAGEAIKKAHMQAYGPKVEATETLYMIDKRTACQKMCGCKKGLWTIYNGNTKVGETKKMKKPCQCAKYYTMTDADGTMIARIQISPTLCQALNKTCRKCTCQCCCLCRVCDCIRCKCCVAKPDVRVLAPTFKEKVDIFYKAKCCGAPKTKIYYPTMYIPGQGDADEGKNEAADDPKDAATDDAPIEGGDGYQKYNKQTKGAKKGEPGEKQKYYLKKPKYATCGCIPDVGMKRDIAKCLGAGATEAFGGNITDIASDAKNSTDAKGGKLKGWKKSLDDVFDIQYGENFTTSQKAGALLAVLWEYKKEQLV